ncbi:SLC13 family permease [Pseudomonas sp. 5P_3.1_Bac2]|uniref:SLC13 family permease n=1 Tax=Pseudomonas sp. 5P_3.1_Bac2 TaxID=2971617 RepID=UPI0021C67FBC|nr:SLC13 family permease [Pseudomonas sp. 5P_3.1_Bac2]MCU1719520.1 SLC13 family permease [Pseudomonas sp. 5P_3.1_Bac2]
MAFWLVTSLFVLTYLGMALGRLPGLRVDRSWLAGAAAVLLLFSGAVTPQQAASHLDAGALLLLLGLMLISAQFDFSGVYAWLNQRLSHWADRPALLLLGVVLLSGLLSAILVNDIVAFALTPLLCHSLLARQLDPRPFLLALALAANAGSSASLIGNPQNILLGQAGNLDFWGYMAVAAVPALAALVISYGVIYWQWHKRWGVAQPVPPADEGAPAQQVYGARSYLKPLLASAVLLMLFSSSLPREFSALAVAAALMISRRFASRDYVQQVDWNLLLLFAGLFIVTGAAVELPQITALAQQLSEAGWLPEGLWSLTGVALVGGNLIGNVPLVILLLGVLPEASQGLLISLAILSTLAGNLLIIGSVVNLIVAESAQRQGVQLGFMDFARSGLPVTLLSLAVAVAWLGLGGWLPW